MANEKRGRGQHGPIKYFTEEERKRANTKRKTKYMLNKEWRCDVCGGYNYRLAGKHQHLKAKNIKSITKKIFIQIEKFMIGPIEFNDI